MTANRFMVTQNSIDSQRLVGGHNIVTNSFAFLHDAGLPAVVSTVITLCYLLLKIGTWLADIFYAIPNQTKMTQITTARSRSRYTKNNKKKSKQFRRPIDR